MLKPQLYIIAGPNGAGKTTASFTILPEMLDIKEFVNADEIARGLSPFQPGSVRIKSGKIFLNRINRLIELKSSFAFETTLASKGIKSIISRSRKNDYEINLIFFLLNSPDLAVQRVARRVSEGGHDIPEKEIRRRFDRGLKNLFTIYQSRVDNWSLWDSSDQSPNQIASFVRNELVIKQPYIYKSLKAQYEGI